MALEASEVEVARLGSAAQALQRDLSVQLAREIAHNHRIMVVLGSMHADERIAAFLLEYSGRMSDCGYSAREFRLPMTRADIGSYLGLQLETVSRLFSSFASKGLIEVDKAFVRLLDAPALERVLRER